MIAYQSPYATLYQGHVLSVLRTMEPESVHACVTSPPYYGLRAYGTDPQVWGEPGEGCEHVWGEEGVTGGPAGAQGSTSQRKGRANVTEQVARGRSQGAFCSRSGCWRGELGSEPTLALYLAHLVEVFEAVKRVLRRDGVCWINMGDAYAGSWGNQGRKAGRGAQRPINGPMIQAVQDGRYQDNGSGTGTVRDPGIKPKDLMLIPARLAIALQENGWWVRSDCIWHKPNPMPSSVTDRPGTAHEYLFMLTKAAKYYYDAWAVRQPSSDNPISSARRTRADNGATGRKALHGTAWGQSGNGARNDDGERHLRSVWTIPTEAYPGSHFATFSTKLVEPCVLASTSQEGVCSTCGTPWKREVERQTRQVMDYNGKNAEQDTHFSGRRMLGNVRAARAAGADHDHPFPAPQTLGWHAGCKCNAPTQPAVILDPFAGTSTVGAVAIRHGRRFVGIELSERYCRLSAKRLAGANPVLPLDIEPAAEPEPAQLALMEEA